MTAIEALSAHRTTKSRKHGGRLINEINTQVINLDMITHTQFKNTVDQRTRYATFMAFNEKHLCVIANSHPHARIGCMCTRRHKTDHKRLCEFCFRGNRNIKRAFGEGRIQSNYRIR